MQALILAAGKGERLRPLTDTRPKVMLPVVNKPILEHNLELVAGLVDEIIIVVGYKGEVVRGYFGDSFGGVKIRYVEQEKQLGTGDAIFRAEPHIKGRFLVMMGDNIYSKDDIQKCLKHDFCMLVKKVQNPSMFGVCVTRGDRIEKIVEKPKNFVSDLANAGLYVMDREIFDFRLRRSERGEYEIIDALVWLGKKRPLYWVAAGRWFQVTYPWDLLELNEIFLKESGPVIDKSAKISGRALIEGPVAIGRNAELKNCVIRAYSSIGEGAVIGNFVEIKNSIVMDKTRIPHLSYVGDSVIGSGCNLGAGTSVANLRFDDKPVKMSVKGGTVDSGRRKLGCVMGDGTKTGINVSILPGAMIKPGSTIFPGSTYK